MYEAPESYENSVGNVYEDGLFKIVKSVGENEIRIMSRNKEMLERFL